jgi:hypothetical protein
MVPPNNTMRINSKENTMTRIGEDTLKVSNERITQKSQPVARAAIGGAEFRASDLMQKVLVTRPGEAFTVTCLSPGDQIVLSGYNPMDVTYDRRTHTATLQLKDKQFWAADLAPRTVAIVGRSGTIAKFAVAIAVEAPSAWTANPDNAQIYLKGSLKKPFIATPGYVDVRFEAPHGKAQSSGKKIGD